MDLVTLTRMNSLAADLYKAKLAKLRKDKTESEPLTPISDNAWGSYTDASNSVSTSSLTDVEDDLCKEEQLQREAFHERKSDQDDTRYETDAGNQRLARRLVIVEVIYRFMRRFVKGFTIGFLARASLTALVVVLKTRGNINKIRAGFVGALTVEPVQYGAALGGYIAIVETVLRLSRYTGAALSLNMRALFSGGVGGLSLLAMPPALRPSIAVFFFVRALEVAVRIYNERKPGSIPEPFKKYGDCMLLGAASSVNCYQWLMDRATVESSYRHFFDTHAQLPLAAQQLALYMLGGPRPGYGEVPPMEIVRSKVEDMRERLHVTREIDLSHPRVLCHVIHPQTELCIAGMALMWVEGMRRAIPLYVPVFAVPLVLFRSKSIVSRPTYVLLSTLLSVLRSANFLAVHCAVALNGLCFLSYLTGKRQAWYAAISGFIGGGGALLLEKPSRRIELSLYIFSHALQSGYKGLLARGWVPRIPYFDLMLFMASMSTLMYCYVAEPKCMRASYHSLLRFLLGSGGRLEGLVNEHPSRHARLSLSNTRSFPPSALSKSGIKRKSSRLSFKEQADIFEASQLPTPNPSSVSPSSDESSF